MLEPTFNVGMGDIHVAKGPAKYQCIGLGSCIGLALYDPTTDISGMIHVVLSELPSHRDNEPLGKYADTGIPELLRQMTGLGARTSRLLAAYGGGAHLFSLGSQTSTTLRVGDRNIAAVQKLLESSRILTVAKDVAGGAGRTMIFHATTGVVTIRTLNEATRDLCNLKEAIRGRVAA